MVSLGGIIVRLGIVLGSMAAIPTHWERGSHLFLTLMIFVSRVCLYKDGFHHNSDTKFQATGPFESFSISKAKSQTLSKNGTIPSPRSQSLRELSIFASSRLRNGETMVLVPVTWIDTRTWLGESFNLSLMSSTLRQSRANNRKKSTR